MCANLEKLAHSSRKKALTLEGKYHLHPAPNQIYFPCQLSIRSILCSVGFKDKRGSGL